MKPTLTVVAAVTLDGKIARHSGHFSDWTSPEDKDHLHAELDASDVIIVGKVTYELAREPLSKRNCIVFTRGVSEALQESPLLTWLNPETTDIMKFITEHNYKKVCLLGGTQIYSYFLERNLIDEISLTIEPLVFGEGLPLFSCAIEPHRFALVSTKKLNNKGSLVLHYKRVE